MLPWTIRLKALAHPQLKCMHMTDNFHERFEVMVCALIDASRAVSGNVSGERTVSYVRECSKRRKILISRCAHIKSLSVTDIVTDVSIPKYP